MDIRERVRGGLNWMHLTQEEGSCERGNESSGSVKVGEFLDQLSNC
jgi:hypothetical protein